MTLFAPEDRPAAAAIARLVYCNPFVPQRIACEREALGDQFVPSDDVWNVLADGEAPAGLGVTSAEARAQARAGTQAKLARLGERAEAIVRAARERLAASPGGASDADLQLYEELVLYVLYHRSRDHFEQLISKPAELAPAGPARGREREESSKGKDAFYPQFEEAARELLSPPGVRLPTPTEPAHLFAIFFQIRRAFRHIFREIVGRSPASAKLRAAVWESVFTHDMRRYWRALYARMGDITTLITGESGTGKELVARAIGLSRFIPFDAKSRTFAADFAGSFIPLNLSALSPTLIESELFGHRRGAYTGALEDRAGWLEVCPPLGTVFLDEVGELDPLIQVKLLRVLQTRAFQRLGDTMTRMFRGKIVAATNRDLSEELAAGRLRNDFYYRLCADLVHTPPLREQLRQSPGELHSLILYVARRETGDMADEGPQHTAGEAGALAEEVEAWVEKHLGADYPWPGNFRELEQCVRNVMIRREYRPPATPARAPAEELADDLMAGRLTADELLRRYCTLIYAQTHSYEETGRRLGLDRRTVKSKVSRAGDGVEDQGAERT